MSTSRHVALVCIDPWENPESSYRPFNYSVRKVQAALVADPALQHVTTEVIESLRVDVDWFVAKILASDAALVGFSSYVWSFETMVEVARRVKAERPRTCVVFGGPSAAPEMFALPPFRDATRSLDALVKGEGEDSFRAICASPRLDRDALAAIPGLFLPTDEPGVLRSTGARPPPSLDALPSPYELGLVPQGTTGHLETFRGCPLSCTFCQWGDRDNASRVTPESFVRRELAAFERLGIESVYLLDAGLNLNARAFRNLRAAFDGSSLKGRARFRCEVYPAHMTDEHLRFLHDVGTENVGIGLQSFDKEVLRGVERTFDERRFERVVSDVSSFVPETVVEIILGLPGDNPDSFKRTLERVRSLHAEIRVFRCLALPGALMSRARPEHAISFDPHTLELQSCQGWPDDAIEQTCRWVEDEAFGAGGDRAGRATWRFPRPDAPRTVASRPLEQARVPRPAQGEGSPVGDLSGASRGTPIARLFETSVRLFEESVREGSGARWSVAKVERAGDAFEFTVSGASSRLAVRVEPALEGRPAFKVAGGFAFSYRVDPEAPSRDDLRTLEQVIGRLGPALAGAAAPRVVLPVVP
jgi:radical SAM superfamily enzyme YgiQ (UPF0313 family)